MMTILSNISWFVTLAVAIFAWMLTLATLLWTVIMAASVCWTDSMSSQIPAHRTTAAEAFWKKNPLGKVFCVLLVISMGITYSVAATYPF